MDDGLPRVSVIVPAFNAAGTIGRALTALRAQDLDAPYEVIVVDDGSSDGTDRIVAEASGQVRLVRQANQGPAAARNRGAEEARAPLLAFTDADCFPAPGWLRNGLAALEDADFVQGQVLPDPDSTPSPFDRTITIRREYGLYEAANLFVTRRAFDRVGGFEDWLPARIGKPLAEDVWFGWSLRRAGARTAFSPDALVHHAVFPRGPAGYAAERLRLVYFPAMVAKMPELRDAFLYRRWFLLPRTAAFDLVVAAGLVAAATRPRGAGRVVPLAFAMPYLRLLLRRGRATRRAAALILAADLAADSLGLVALATGSIRFGTVVL